jgi:hypothetical protein
MVSLFPGPTVNGCFRSRNYSEAQVEGSASQVLRRIVTEVEGYVGCLVVSTAKDERRDTSRSSSVSMAI